MRIVVSAALVAALAAATSQAFADYTFTDLTPPRTGSDIGSGQPTLANAYAVVGNQQAGQAQVDGSEHAYLWNGAAPGVDYNSTADSSAILALSATQAAGYVLNGSTFRGAVWTPTNTTPQLLNEGAYNNTQATALGGSIIAGVGVAPNTFAHALYWTSPTALPTDLHAYPAVQSAYDSSNASATDGNRVVGSAVPAATTDPHAALWNITAATFTDLHNSTTGFQNSEAVAVGGNQVVGFGATSGDNSTNHALLWTLSGTNDATVTFKDLQPDGYDSSVAAATNGTLIAGYVTDGNGDHAVVWDTPTTFELLTTPVGDSSQALGIDAAGDIVGNVTAPDGTEDAVLWTPAAEPVPEPASLLLLALPLGMLVRRRK